MINEEIEMIFLGSGGTILIPSFHCTCDVCEAARKNFRLKRTRASLALIGKENIIIDVPPEIEFQLEREGIREIDRIFLTHWHYDHMGGLAAFAEPSSHNIWKKKKIDLYLHKNMSKNFDSDLFGFLKKIYNITPIEPGDVIELPDATWEIVKTNHTMDSLGFIINTARSKVAYLVQSLEVTNKTMKKLKDIDILIIDATLDELQLAKNATWRDFTISDAIDFWKETGIETCILTHLSCHRYIINTLEAGFSEEKRKKIELKYPHLKFAFDGMKLSI